LPLVTIRDINYIRSVGRKQINHEQTPARFPEGTLARIDEVLADGEKRSDLIRDAVEREIKRRERQKD
jgi:metal-responsive CopG/Arc/MetJ family transcriptional regulator